MPRTSKDRGSTREEWSDPASSACSGAWITLLVSYTHFIFLLSALTLHFQHQPLLFPHQTSMNKNVPVMFPDVKCLHRALCKDYGDWDNLTWHLLSLSLVPISTRLWQWLLPRAPSGMSYSVLTPPPVLEARKALPSLWCLATAPELQHHLLLQVIGRAQRWQSFYYSSNTTWKPG